MRVNRGYESSRAARPGRPRIGLRLELSGHLEGGRLGKAPQFDSEGRVRVDDLEMRPEIQDAISEVWPKCTTENLEQLTDIVGYRTEFLKMFGFGLPGINYDAEVDPHQPML